MTATKFSVITTGNNPSWHIRVKELPGKHTYKIAVTVAKGSVNTAYGTVSSEWKIEDGMFTIQVQVPVGTTCTLVMPGNTQKVLGSGTYTLKEAIRERNDRNGKESVF